MGAPDDFDLPFDLSDTGAFTFGAETFSLETRIASKRQKAHTVEAKLMNCIAKELAIYNEIKMKCVREVYDLLGEKGKSLFCGCCFNHRN
ncbi:hypothetical protein SADUNF_Sadunf16G0121000 [Salix dunnii]|uniref:Uncharacterized protein n=1 Tax=Salix dunnii TaxID=1413687 RepID=A0A835MGB4_9ROSI|nr:hypothetical protein SADUNF_Sadunf16G0121000 [Salix dunnii]